MKKRRCVAGMTEKNVSSASAVQCELCPKRCVIAPGYSGECRIRVNIDGRLLAVTYGHPCAVHVDPVEKKPLFHFLPGTLTLSLATVGCNLHCRNCQNWEISQANPEETPAYYLPPKKIVALAQREKNCLSVSYTYTEPVVYYEYALACAEAARAAGLRNILVTAAYVNPKPWRRLCRAVDGAHIDLKAMSERFYRENCDGELAPVLDAIVSACSAGVWVEIVNLVIPTLNDSDEMLGALCRWLKRNVGRNVPLHFSAFHPAHLLQHLPRTPVATLLRARDIARAEGLRYVYVGNVTVAGGEDTLCPECGITLINRQRFAVIANRLVAGRCPECQTDIPGIWK